MDFFMFVSAGVSRNGAQQKGFTLVELLVTVSILTVVLAIAVPSMTGLVRDARLAAQSDLLVSSLALARTEAIRQRTNAKVCPSATPNTDTATDCAAAVATWSKGWITIQNASTITQRTVASSELTVVTPAAIAPAKAIVEFVGVTGGATVARSFTLCIPTRKQHIVDVAVSGRISKRIGTTTC